jgi:hypothetical protein
MLQNLSVMRPVIILLTFASLFMLRCAREVIIDLPDEQTKLVAVCHFTEGEIFRVKLSLSKPVNDGSAPVFLQENVDAKLSVNNKFWDSLEPDTTKKDQISYWKGHENENKIAETGVEYFFSVRVPGYPVIETSSKIPVHADLEPILVSSNQISITPIGDGLSELRVPLELRLKTLPPDNHYFAFSLTHEIAVYETLTPPIIDFWEEGYTNFLADGRTFSLLHDIPEPVVLVNENFWADNRKTLSLVARIPFDPAFERPRNIFVEWRTLSEDFYRYHLSLSRQGGNLPFSDPDAVFNNIQGGYGNFSGYAVSRDTILLPNF